MMENFRREPIRSRHLLDSAKGQPCDLNFAGVCNYNPETTVSCHIHDERFGAARKADDTSTIHGCSSCHMYLDHGWVGKIELATLQFYIIRGMQRTTRNRVERGYYGLELDPAPAPTARKPRARKEPGQRAKIPSAPMPKSERRIAQSPDPWGKARKSERLLPS